MAQRRTVRADLAEDRAVDNIVRVISLPVGRTDDDELARSDPDPTGEGAAVRSFRPRRPYLSMDPATDAETVGVDTSAVVEEPPGAGGVPGAAEPTGQARPVEPVAHPGPAGEPAPVVPAPVVPARARSFPTTAVVAVSAVLVALGAMIWIVLYVPARTGPPDAGRRPVEPGAAALPDSVTAPPLPSSTTGSPAAAAGATTGSSAVATPTRARPPVAAARPVAATFTMVPGNNGTFRGELVITNTTSTDRSWEVILVFPSNVGQLRVSASGTGRVEVRDNRVLVASESGPEKNRRFKISGATSDGSPAAPPDCTVDGQPC